MPSLPGVLPWPIRRLSDRGSEQMVAGVVVEEPLEIWIDGELQATLMRTPGQEKELAAGFILGEGLVADLADVALIRHCGRVPGGNREEGNRAEGAHIGAPLRGDGAGGDRSYGRGVAVQGDALDYSRNRVDVTLLAGARQGAKRRARPGSAPLIRSGCGRADATALAEGLVPLEDGVRVGMDVLRHVAAQITSQQAAYRAAGGIHAAAILDVEGRLVAVAEDVGRHNAVDKVTGYCLLRSISLRDKLLVSTGRASFDMVAKGVRLGLPILASLSSPTSAAVELAEALNCTLIGYLRGRTLNVYAHGRRIEPPAGV